MRRRWSTMFVAIAALSLTALTACASEPDVEGSAPTRTASPVPATATSATLTSTSTPTAGGRTCTPGGSPPPSAAPASLEELPEAAIAVLNAGGDAAGLEQALDGWGLLEGGGAVRSADLDGHAPDEVVVLAIDVANATATGAPGLVAVLGCDDAGWHLVHSSAGMAPATPEVVALDDLNGEPGFELLYRLRSCGAHTCVLWPVMIGFRPDDEAVGPLLDVPLETGVPEGGVSVDDTNGDGVREVVVDVGSVGSVGAGPQREYRHTYGWDGTRYSAVSVAVTTPQDQWAVIHFLQDADQIAAAGQYDEALALYERVLLDPPEDTWVGPDELTSLQVYAHYRTMATLAAAGRADGAEAAAAIFAKHAPHASSMPDVIDVGHAFWTEYAASRDTRAACAAAVDYAEQHPQSFDLLNAFGYANDQYTARDLCPFA